MVSSVDDYLASFPADVRVILEKIRSLIRKEAPGAVEGISYGMPGFKLNGKPLVYFAGFKNHIGLYALPASNVEFRKELDKYKTGKGSIQFQLNEPIPYKLIEKIVQFRVKENENK